MFSSLVSFVSSALSTCWAHVWWTSGATAVALGIYLQAQNATSGNQRTLGSQLSKFGLTLLSILLVNKHIGFEKLLEMPGVSSLWDAIAGAPIALALTKVLAVGALLHMFGLLRLILTTLYGEFSSDEIVKFGLLATTLFTIIGSYWTLRSMKDAFFANLVGMKYVPWAKIGTLIVIVPIVLLVNKLVDEVEREKLFWIFCGAYAFFFAGIGYLYNNGTPLITSSLPMLPGNALGWLSFITIETFGGVIVALFWSYANSTTNTALSKRGYPLIYIAAQMGNFAGPTIVTNATTLGFSNIFFIAAAAVITVPMLIGAYRTVVPQALRESDGSTETKKKTGALEGLRLIGRYEYLMGLAFISTVYEVIGTILDMQFKLLASQQYTAEALAAYLGRYGQVTAAVGFAFAVLGTSFVIRNLGVRLSLLLYPSLLGLVVVLVRMTPQLSILFAGMVAVKMLSYTLNNPLKELMYIPTTKDVKFKVKSVIDGFGGKLSKGIGSGINSAFAGQFHALMTWGSLISLGIVGFWFVIAIFVGRTYDKLIKSKEIIG